MYPTPQQAGLGVHATLDLAGTTRFGPDVEWVNTPDFDVDASRARHFYRQIRKYWPGLEDNKLIPAYAGIRPKLQGPGGGFQDFMIQDEVGHGIPGLIHLFGIESPGLTASLAIARHVRGKLLGEIDG